LGRSDFPHLAPESSPPSPVGDRDPLGQHLFEDPSGSKLFPSCIKSVLNSAGFSLLSPVRITTSLPRRPCLRHSTCSSSCPFWSWASWISRHSFGLPRPSLKMKNRRPFSSPHQGFFMPLLGKFLSGIKKIALQESRCAAASCLASRRQACAPWANPARIPSPISACE